MQPKRKAEKFLLRVSKKPDEPLLRVEEVACWLNVSKRSVYRLLSNGQIGAIPIRGSIRISPQEVRAFQARQAQKFLWENCGK